MFEIEMPGSLLIFSLLVWAIDDETVRELVVVYVATKYGFKVGCLVLQWLATKVLELLGEQPVSNQNNEYAKQSWFLIVRVAYGVLDFGACWWVYFSGGSLWLCAAAVIAVEMIVVAIAARFVAPLVTTVRRVN